MPLLCVDIHSYGCWLPYRGKIFFVCLHSMFVSHGRAGKKRERRGVSASVGGTEGTCWCEEYTLSCQKGVYWDQGVISEHGTMETYSVGIHRKKVRPVHTLPGLSTTGTTPPPPVAADPGLPYAEIRWHGNRTYSPFPSFSRFVVFPAKHRL